MQETDARFTYVLNQRVNDDDDVESIQLDHLKFFNVALNTPAKTDLKFAVFHFEFKTMICFKMQFFL